jgi:two-component system cell cycle sensor histidine kinase/response regulator CckA
VLRVSDTGAGIPASLMQKIFQPFFTTKSCEKGTGLGLSTVAKIVQSHHGFIEVASEVGAGSTFTVYLPAAGTETLPLMEDGQALGPIGHGEHILLVDDECAVLEMTCAMLVANDYKVTTARNGAEALRLFREHLNSIAVIVTDLIMPTMDGATLIREARGLRPQVNVICITGMWFEAKHPELSETDARACMRKPYTAGELLRALRDVLEAEGLSAFSARVASLPP